MFRSKRMKSALLVITLFIAGLVLTLGSTGLADRGGGKDQKQPAKSQQGASHNQKGGGSGNTARSVGSHQGASNAAKPANNVAARSQGRQKAVGPAGNAGAGRSVKQNAPSTHAGISAPRPAQRGESLQGWGTRARVDPVYINRWHQPRYEGGSYHYDGFGYTSGFHYGYWAFGHPNYRHYNSPFFFFGLLFIYAERAVIARPPAYAYYSAPGYNYGSGNSGGYYLSPGKYSGLHAALDDIRNAWITDNSDPIVRHIDPGARLAVYSDGKYSYSIFGKDYRSLTADAMHHTSTITFAIYKVKKRSDGAYIAFAKQQFYDVDNNYKVAFVSYTMTPRHGKWVMVAVGSSAHRLG